MKDLDLKEIPEDNKFLARTKRTLLKNFNIGSGNRIDDAVLLATYLKVIGRIDESSALLESFVYGVESKSDRRDQWGAVGQGILLLAAIYREKGDSNKERELVSYIVEDDIMSDRLSRAEYLAEDLSEHHEIIDYYKQESHKYRCRILAQQILTFTYFYEMFPTYQHEVHESEKLVIEKIIETTSSLLAEEIG